MRYVAKMYLLQADIPHQEALADIQTGSVQVVSWQILSREEGEKMICPKCGMDTGVYVAVGSNKLCVPCYAELRGKQEEYLAKLFNAIIDYEKNRNDPVVQANLREQKNLCIIRWPSETLRIIQDAYRYLARQRGINC